MIVSAASKNSIERPYIPLPYAFWPNSNICLAVALLSACSCATCKLEPTQQMISPPCSSVRVLFCFWLGQASTYVISLQHRFAARENKKKYNHKIKSMTSLLLLFYLLIIFACRSSSLKQCQRE